MKRLWLICLPLLLSCMNYKKFYEGEIIKNDFASDGYTIIRQYGHPMPIINFRTMFKDYTYNRKLAKVTNIKRDRDSITILFRTGFNMDTVTVTQNDSIVFSAIIHSINDPYTEFAVELQQNSGQKVKRHICY